MTVVGHEAEEDRLDDERQGEQADDRENLVDPARAVISGRGEDAEMVSPRPSRWNDASSRTAPTWLLAR
ncbi:MAG: hypothetical protein M3188_00755 [Actinomycetota bacterium]|nr:hypothetical protein [Actinomycetota bacterium]